MLWQRPVGSSQISVLDLGVVVVKAMDKSKIGTLGCPVADLVNRMVLLRPLLLRNVRRPFFEQFPKASTKTSVLLWNLTIGAGENVAFCYSQKITQKARIRAYLQGLQPIGWSG